MTEPDWAALADQLQAEADYWAREYELTNRDMMDEAGEIAALMRDTLPDEREAKLYARLEEHVAWSQRQMGRDDNGKEDRD